MRRFLLTLVWLMAFSGSSGALWQSQNWALSAGVNAVTGYDSNLTASREAEADAFASAQTELTLKRWGGATRLEFTGEVTGTKFIRGRAEDQLDGGLSARFAYPFIEGTEPRYSGLASWRQSTFASSLMGRRITARLSRLDLASRLYSTGKISLDGEFGYARSDYTSEDLNQNDRLSVTAGVAYEITPRVELSVSSLSSYEVSKPTTAGGAKSKSWQQGFTFRAKGAISAKWNSSAYVGATAVRYRGAYRGSDVLPVAGGGLTFEATPRRSYRLGLDFGSDFSPEGEAMKTQAVAITATQGIYSNWRLTARVAPSRVVRQRAAGESLKDKAVTLGTSLAYDATKKVTAEVGYEFTRQTSNRADLSFTRHYTSARVVYRF